MTPNKKRIQLYIILGILFSPLLAFAGLESSLGQITAVISKVILPVMAIISLLFAGFSFMTQNQNCKTHLLYSVIGIFIAAGSSLLFNFLKGIIR